MKNTPNIMFQVSNKFDVELNGLEDDATRLRIKWNQLFPSMTSAKNALDLFSEKFSKALSKNVKHQKDISFAKEWVRWAFIIFKLFPKTSWMAYVVILGLVAGILFAIVQIFPEILSAITNLYTLKNGAFAVSQYRLTIVIISAHLFLIAPLLAYLEQKKQTSHAMKSVNEATSHFKNIALVYALSETQVYAISLSCDSMNWIFKIELSAEFTQLIYKDNPSHLSIMFFPENKTDAPSIIYGLKTDSMQLLYCSNQLKNYEKRIARFASLATADILKSWNDTCDYFQHADTYFSIKSHYIEMLKSDEKTKIQAHIWDNIYVHPKTQSELMDSFSSYLIGENNATQSIILEGPLGAGKEFLATLLSAWGQIHCAVMDKTAFKSADNMKSAWGIIRKVPKALIYIPDADQIFNESMYQESILIWERLKEVDQINHKNYFIVLGTTLLDNIPNSIIQSLQCKIIHIEGLDAPTITRFFNDYMKNIRIPIEVPEKYIALLAGSTLSECRNFIDTAMTMPRTRNTLTTAQWNNAFKQVKSSESYTYTESIQAIENMVGLHAVKEEIHTLIKQAQFQQKMKDHLQEIPFTQHLIFAGNPGTGKTTIARYLASIYHHWGIIKKNICIECSRKDLIGEYVGETSTKTANKIAEAQGGILFIDEAYSLHDASENGYGKEAITEILTAMENHRNDMVVIVAGYEKEMKNFLDMNPGLLSRFKKWVFFEDYTASEMTTIFQNYLTGANYQLENDAQPLIQGLFNMIFARKSQHFGNAREVRKIFEKCVTAHQKRILDLP